MPKYFLYERRVPPDLYHYVAWKEGSMLRFTGVGGDGSINDRQLPDDRPLDAEGIHAFFDAMYPNQVKVFGECVPGRYFPRVWRPELRKKFIEFSESTLPPTASGHAEALAAAANAAELLMERLRQLFRVVEPVDRQFDVYGQEIRHLLILGCTEVEAAFRGVLTANGVVKERMNMNDYIRLRDPLRLPEWKVRLTRSVDGVTLNPFVGWDEDEPARSLPWWESYNHTKHDSHANLAEATLGNAIKAAAALHVMLLAQFGPAKVAAAGLREFAVVEQPHQTAADAYLHDVTNAKERDRWWHPEALFQ